MNKTIFRLTTAGLMLAGVIAFGAAAGWAQDPCTDAAGQTAMQDEYDKLWAGRNDPDPAKAVENRKQAINSGKAFLDKYGACASAELRATWLKTNLPKQEETVKKMGADAERVVRRPVFAAAKQMGRCPWDEVPLADVRDSACHDVEPAICGFAGGRRHAVEALLHHSMGDVGESYLRPSGNLERDVDVAPLAGVPRHSAGYEGGGRPAFPAGH